MRRGGGHLGRGTGGRCSGRGCGLYLGRLGRLALGDELAERIIVVRGGRRRRRRRVGGQFAAAGQALLNQLGQGVELLRWVQVQHQAVLVGRNRLQGEDLRLGRLLQIEHHAHHVGAVLADADGGDIGVIGLHFDGQLFERVGQLHALNVHRQARWIGDEGLRGLERFVRFERDAGIVRRRPDPHGHHAGAKGNLLATQ